MNRTRTGRRVMAAGGGAALIALGALTVACGIGDQTPSPATMTTTSSSVPASSTEKSISPTGGNLFTPPVSANPAPNVHGGQHPGINGIP
jgi:hypothetical protein